MTLYSPFEQRILALSPAEVQSSFEVVFPPVDYKEKYVCVLPQYILKAVNIGTATIWINRDEQRKVISWHGFTPLTFLPNLKKNGIGTLAHVLTMIQLVPEANIDREFEVKHDYRVLSKGRAQQLASMGIHPRGEDIQPYLEKCINYAQRKGFTFTNPL